MQGMLRRRGVLVALTGAMAGCSHGLPTSEGYDETIEMIALSSTGDKLLVLGESFHYLFKLDRAATKSLAGVLRSELRPHLTAAFREWHVVSADGVGGYWTLWLPERGLTPHQVELATALGFKSGLGMRYFLEDYMVGTRFAKNEVQIADAQRTNGRYRLHVQAAPRVGGALSKSPVSGGDMNAMVIGLVVFVPLAILLSTPGGSPRTANP